MQRGISYILMFLFAGLMACTPEYKLAREFRSSPPDFFFRVSPPGFLYKYNHKGEQVVGLASMTASQQDSALFYSSSFVQYVNDTAFLESYINAFLEELRALKLPVFIGNEADSFLQVQQQAYDLKIAQIQLDEYFYPYEDQEFFYDTLFYKKFDLNAVDFSVWLEVSKLGRDAQTKTVLYSSHMASDNLDGEFFLDPFRQHVKYSYTIDSLDVEDINNIARFLGKVHAGYLYDFFLNQYIAFHIPKGYKPEVYYHYNRFRDSYIPVEEERFELLDGQ